jgi:hypothetical protein
MLMRLLWVVVILLAAGASAGRAQDHIIRPASELDHYTRFLELDGDIRGLPLIFRSLSTPGVVADTGHLWERQYPFGPEAQVRRFGESRWWLRWIDPELLTVANTSYPRTVNDGALWAGRGLSGSLTGGVQLGWGPLTGTLYPTIYAAANREFPLAPVPWNDRSRYAYQWQRNLDWPQRPGDRYQAEYDWGQSGVRLNLDWFTAGLSTENLWWGPGYRNAIIMSNTAPGIPHVDIGTGRPTWIGIGDLEVRAIWGESRESEFFDSVTTNDRRYVTGITLAYQPSFLPGLKVGGARLLYQTWPTGGLTFRHLTLWIGDWFKVAEPLPDGTLFQDSTDQLASLFARWTLPKSGFEAYVEWARNDFSGGVRDLVLEPDHSSGYTIGFQKSLPSGPGRWLLAGEFTTLGPTAASLHRGSPPFYPHGIAVGGYSHRGQLMGAGIGTGANSQYLGLHRYHGSGRWGVWGQRVRFDDDAHFRAVPPGGGAYESHQVEFTLGFGGVHFVGDFDLGGRLELNRELNRYWEVGNDVTSVSFELSARWRVPAH